MLERKKSIYARRTELNLGRYVGMLQVKLCELQRCD